MGSGSTRSTSWGFSMGAMTALALRRPAPPERAPDPGRRRAPRPDREPRASVGRPAHGPQPDPSLDPPFVGCPPRPHATTRARAPARGSDSSPRSPPDIAAQPLLVRRRSSTASIAPTMVVCGDHDPFVPPEHARRPGAPAPEMAASSSRPDCGHEVMPPPARAVQRGAGPASIVRPKQIAASSVRRGRGGRRPTGIDDDPARAVSRPPRAAPRRWPRSSPLRDGAPAARGPDARAARATRVWRVDERARRRDGPRPRAAMGFDYGVALDEGPPAPIRCARGRILREIAPGLATFLVLEDAPDLVDRGLGPPGTGWILSG